MSTAARLDPRIETESGLAGILHWQQSMATWDSGGSPGFSLQEAHCLMRLVYVGGSPTVILSELMSCPVRQSHHYFSAALSPVLAPCATAAYSILKDQIPNPAEIVWVIHCGDFSTPDTMYVVDGTEDFTQVELHWTGSEFAPEPLAAHRPLPVAFSQSAKLELVKVVLRQLGGMKRSPGGISQKQWEASPVL